MGTMVQASQLGVAKVLHFGTEEQKRDGCRALPLVNPCHHRRHRAGIWRPCTGISGTAERAQE